MRSVRLCIGLSIMFYLVLCPTAWTAESTGVELVQLTTADGVKLNGVMRRPHPSRYQAGIVLIHGYSGNFYSSVMQFLPAALTNRGFYTLAVNHLVSLRGPETFSDPHRNIGRISLPILIVHGLADRLAEPEVADRLSSHAGTGSKVKVVKIAGAGHGFRNHQQELVNTTYNWLHKQLTP